MDYTPHFTVGNMKRSLDVVAATGDKIVALWADPYVYLIERWRDTGEADEIVSRLYLLLLLRILRKLIMCLEEILQEGFSSGLLVAQSDEPSLVQVYIASCIEYGIYSISCPRSYEYLSPPRPSQETMY
jgi:hypothetical protein